MKNSEATRTIVREMLRVSSAAFNACWAIAIATATDEERAMLRAISENFAELDRSFRR